MTAATQVKTRQVTPPDKSQLRFLLRKEWRQAGFEPGNRNRHVNATAWYTAMRRDRTRFHYIIDRFAATPGRAQEAKRIRRRILRDLQRHNARAREIANGLLQQHRFKVSRRYYPNALRALTAIIAYGRKSAISAAAEGSLANHAKLSQAAMSRWIQRFRDAEILQLIGYDWRGRREYAENRHASNYTLVLWIPHLDARQSTEAQAGPPASRSLYPPNSKENGRDSQPPAFLPRPPPSFTATMQFLCPKPGEWHFDSIAETESECEQARELQGAGFRVYWPVDE